MFAHLAGFWRLRILAAPTPAIYIFSLAYPFKHFHPPVEQRRAALRRIRGEADGWGSVKRV